ncbi:hypothetical protein BX600DRAFT_121869 [Xylariales sp. PMI_506]|nr:hypothetical protein BX600DRAFT_121869 [Xylariales sp. PMI_506]
MDNAGVLAELRSWSNRKLPRDTIGCGSVASGQIASVGFAGGLQAAQLLVHGGPTARNAPSPNGSGYQPFHSLRSQAHLPASSCCDKVVGQTLTSMGVMRIVTPQSQGKGFRKSKHARTDLSAMKFKISSPKVSRIDIRGAKQTLITFLNVTLPFAMALRRRSHQMKGAEESKTRLSEKERTQEKKNKNATF